MFSVPRFIGGLAAASLMAIAAMPPAQAAGNVGYADSLCTAFYTDPFAPPPNQVLKCAKLVCSVTTDVSFFQPLGSPIRMTVSCRNSPAVLTFKWVKSPQSPATCPSPTSPADATSSIAIVSNVGQTCWYEAIATDGANPQNTGWTRYGLKWQ